MTIMILLFDCMLESSGRRDRYFYWTQFLFAKKQSISLPSSVLVFQLVTG
uniref:Uncharacterized protein n=1 Tax=Anguilla anguilla TaxID=7936 RepID=A0A0E9U188_ANGAN